MLPPSFPQSDYTPFGYIDNPYHSWIANRSGAIRSLPPMGYGYWCRAMKFPYGGGVERHVSYLSFLYPSVNVDGVTLHTSKDFAKNNISIVSKYHTKTMMSYDWQFKDISFSAKYFLPMEHCLACVIEVRNEAKVDKTITVHATNIYGWPRGWWGSDGFTARYNEAADAGICKIWAYGDQFALGADRVSTSHKFTTSQDEWNRWMSENDLSSNESDNCKGKGPMYSVLSYRLGLRPGQSESMLICLARGVNESATLKTHREGLGTAVETLKEQLSADERFYSQTPQLSGDWADYWKHGWIYDWETLRMTMRPPVGIYKHHWDGMQPWTPRLVLGETMLDTMCLSYADLALAKEVIYGTFADAPEDNIPCSREDGSVNMVSAGGHESGTAPIWGFPFHVIWSIYLRDQDNQWAEKLYPHLKDFIEWWLKYRTGKEGSFYTVSSWESGQDGSKRFKIAGEGPGDVAEIVRTVDIEAAMAEAMSVMSKFARLLNKPKAEIDYWSKMAKERTESTRAMFVDGWFRDFDSRNNTPIIIEDYYDIMMLTPVTVGVATAEQIDIIRPKFKYFKDNPLFWLEWPSFMFPFAEAAWSVGERQFIGQVIFETGERIYQRLDERQTQPPAHIDRDLPAEFNYRLPGVSDEFWPIKKDNPGGCECYGWGATLPFHVIRNIIGFREINDLVKGRFYLAPGLASAMLKPGKTYGIANLKFRRMRFDVSYQVENNKELTAVVDCRFEGPAASVTVSDEKGKTIGQSGAKAKSTQVRFRVVNGGLYTVTIN